MNTQLSYMILRGAGKQYGVIWLLNGSTCSRFGNKCYNPTAPAQQVLRGLHAVAVAAAEADAARDQLEQR